MSLKANHPKAVFALLALTCCTIADGADWITLGGNHDHNFATEDALRFPLELEWQRQRPPAQPAFAGMLADPRENLSFTEDLADQPVIADGRILVPSSAEQTLTCYDIASGRETWCHFAEGPVRVAPTVHDDVVICSSDDGRIVGLDLDSGTERWRIDEQPYRRHAIGRERMCSAWPVRSGVHIADGIAYGARGCNAPHGTWVYAFDPLTGKLIWDIATRYSPQGRLLVQEGRLIVATGRTAPFEIELADRQHVFPEPFRRRGHGSSWLGRVAGLVCYGPCETGVILIRVPKDWKVPVKGSDVGITGQLTGIRAWRLTENSDTVFACEPGGVSAYARDGFLGAVDAVAGTTVPGARAYQKYGRVSGGADIVEDPRLRKPIDDYRRWRVENPCDARAMVRAGNALIVGGEELVVAYAVEDGKELWRRGIEGRAHGLAVSNGRLVVSSDSGQLSVFGPAAGPGFIAEHHSPASASAGAVALAGAALSQADCPKGWILVLAGPSMPEELPQALAVESEFHILVVDRDAARVDALRRRLRAAGLYGRVAVHASPDGRLAYPHGFANLTLLLDAAWEPRAVRRLIQPYGGTLVSRAEPGPAWTTHEYTAGRVKDLYVLRRGTPEGAGEWPNLYADFGNSANSGDSIVGTDVNVQWWGPPGPEDVIDRHNLAMPSVFRAGKLYIPGEKDSLCAVDAYNGTILWKVDTPGSKRQWISHTHGSTAAGEDVVFIACSDGCREIDGNTGELRHTYPAPDGMDWGAVALSTEGFLVGTGQEHAATLLTQGRRLTIGTGSERKIINLIEAKLNHSRPVAGRSITVIDPTTRKTLWQRSGASYLHPTLCGGEGLLFVAESRSPEVRANEYGTAFLPEFFANGQGRLVARDIRTGEERWSRILPQISDHYEHIMFLLYSDGILLSVRTGHLDGSHIGYRFEAYEAGTGKPIWDKDVMSKEEVYAPLSYGKNMQAAHPAIVRGRIYWLAHTFGTMFCYDLASGADHSDTGFGAAWQNKGCAPPSASDSALYYRHTYTMQYCLDRRVSEPLLMVGRPGCWMSVITGGGLILEPEAGKGCSCGLPSMQSTGMSPREW